MRAVYILGDFSEVEIAGHDDEWAAFALCLEQGAADMDCEIAYDPAPYSAGARKIHLVTAPGEKVRFAVDRDGNVAISGDPALLQGLSRTVANFARDFNEGEHIHVDYQGEEHFIGQDSTPTVLFHLGRSTRTRSS